MYIQLRALRAGRKRHRIKLRYPLIIIMLLTAGALTFGSAHIDEVLSELAEPAAINLLNDTVNACYSKFIEGAQIDYDDLVTVTRNDSGQITSLTTNAELLNLMCLQINDDVSAALNKENVKIKVPLGSLTDSEILSGLGPSFSMSLSQSNTVDTYTESAFKEAGVNQTEHEILFSVVATMTLILPDTTVTYEYYQSFIVTQSIIVGDVPSYYTGLQ